MKLFLIALLLSNSFLCVAQDTTKVPKFKPPVVKSYLGLNTDGATVSVDEASQLIALPLKITDDKKNVYAIASYGFLYKKKGMLQDEETGKKKCCIYQRSKLF